VSSGFVGPLSEATCSPNVYELGGAEHDYEVNLKAELEIMLLHDKIDQLRQKQWTELLAIQQQQLTLLAGLIARPPR
jgi:hypothetical protein